MEKKIVYTDEGYSAKQNGRHMKHNPVSKRKFNVGVGYLATFFFSPRKKRFYFFKQQKNKIIFTKAYLFGLQDDVEMQHVIFISSFPFRM